MLGTFQTSCMLGTFQIIWLVGTLLIPALNFELLAQTCSSSLQILVDSIRQYKTVFLAQLLDVLHLFFPVRPVVTVGPAAMCVLPVEEAELGKPKSKRVGLAGQEDGLVCHIDHDDAAP